MSKATRKATAYEYLRQSILSQRLKPGQPLIEIEIASDLGMSRTPVREALRELSQEGLVETFPNRGAVVRVLSADELLDIFDIKIRLEGLCAARAAEHNGPEVAQKLTHFIEQMETAAKCDDLQRYLQADDAYHAAIYEGAQNERACQIVGELNAQWHRMRIGMLVIESRMETAVAEHRLIADSIARSDATSADKAMQIHLENLRNEIRTHLEALSIHIRSSF